MLNYSIYGTHTNIEKSAHIADYLEGPIVIQERADLQCPGNQTYFSFYKTIPIGPTDDTWIQKGGMVAKNGGSNLLDTNGFGFTPFQADSDPDNALATAFLQFGIGQVQTNAQLDESYLLIQADTNVTNVEAPFLLYRVKGPWTEETLTYENKPATDLSEYLIVNANDTVSGLGYEYNKDITSYTKQWLNGSKADHGIRLVSTSRHVFASKESFFTTIPTIGLNLNLPVEHVDPILEVGYVEAGDTLNVAYLGFDQYLNFNFSLNPDSINAENILSFGENTGCQSQNNLNLLPFMEEAPAKKPYFEFTLIQNLTIPIDSVTQKEIYLEPQLKFENGATKLPGNIFTFLTMEIYDVPFIELPGIPQSVPLALLDGEPDGRTFLGSYRPEDNIEVLALPEASDSTFKIRIVGEIIKGLIATKQNTLAAPTRGFLPAYSTIEGVKSNIENDPYCGIPEEYAKKEGFFVTCFEFTIGGALPMIAQAVPNSISKGDTTLIDVRYIDEHGDTLGFPSNQVFSVGIEESFQNNGTLLAPNGADTADVLLDIPQGFSFIASYSTPDTTIPIIVTTNFNQQLLMDTAIVTINSNAIEILLGESKYFYAVADAEDPSKLLIKELQVNNSSTDPLNLPAGGVVDAFSNNDIIEVISG